jgi:metal-dependent amidase/aminoacylase/carboxypeptidase family protein
VGSLQAGTKSNIIPDQAALQLNISTYSETTRTRILEAVRRMVNAGCAASGSPKEAEFELFDPFPLTDNDAGADGIRICWFLRGPRRGAGSAERE